jgi:hypothetical protein
MAQFFRWFRFMYMGQQYEDAVTIEWPGGGGSNDGFPP